MPYNPATNNNWIGVDFGALGGDMTGVTITNKTATSAQASAPITLESVIKHYEGGVHKFWASLKNTALGCRGAKEVRIPVHTPSYNYTASCRSFSP